MENRWFITTQGMFISPERIPHLTIRGYVSQKLHNYEGGYNPPKVSDSTGGTCMGLSLHVEKKLSQQESGNKKTQLLDRGSSHTHPSLNGYRFNIVCGSLFAFGLT